MLQLEYLALQAAASRLEAAPQDVLALLGFPEIPAEAAPRLPGARVAMRAAGGGAPTCELWTSVAPVSYASHGDIRYALAGDLIFGVVAAPEARGPLQERTREVYAAIFSLLDKVDQHHVLRFWNYIPRINEIESGIERYRSFNMGRHSAFEAAGRLQTETIPAASGLGTRDGQDLIVCFIASRKPGRQVENPRQAHAWQYPRQYGPKSPTFSRALAYPFDEPKMLFVSGTASIVGHETVHVGDVTGQVRETLANLEAVFAEASRFGRHHLAQAKLKAYVRDAAYADVVRREVAAALGESVNITCLVADICRADLLVEIEAFA